MIIVALCSIGVAPSLESTTWSALLPCSKPTLRSYCTALCLRLLLYVKTRPHSAHSCYAGVYPSITTRDGYAVTNTGLFLSVDLICNSSIRASPFSVLVLIPCSAGSETSIHRSAQCSKSFVLLVSFCFLELLSMVLMVVAGRSQNVGLTTVLDVYAMLASTLCVISAHLNSNSSHLTSCTILGPYISATPKHRSLALRCRAERTQISVCGKQLCIIV